MMCWHRCAGSSMPAKAQDRQQDMHAVNKILFLSLTNVGDVILTLPALDVVRGRFAGARITVVSGPRAAGLFAGNPAFASVITFDKRARFREKWRFFRALQREKFDLVVDLRNSLMGFLLGGVRLSRKSGLPAHTHASRCHRSAVAPLEKYPGTAAQGGSIFVGKDDREYIDGLYAQLGWGREERIAVFSPGARSGIKRWHKERFRDLAAEVVRDTGCKVALIGDAADREVAAYIARDMRDVADFAGKTTLPQLAYLLSRAAVLVTNDSANLHLAGYLDVPVVAVFGPTDDLRYGPWSRHSRVVKADIACRPCKKAQCAEGSLRCMEMIRVGEVKEAVAQVLREAVFP